MITPGAIGMISGAVAKVVVYPMDTIKKRLQIVGMERNIKVYGPIGKYSGTRDAITSIVKEEGFQALYRGLIPAIMKVTLSLTEILETSRYLMK
jgi:hypothetical protein